MTSGSQQENARDEPELRGGLWKRGRETGISLVGIGGLVHHPEGSEEALPRLNQESKGHVHFSKSSVGGTIWINLLAIDTRIFA